MTRAEAAQQFLDCFEGHPTPESQRAAHGIVEALRDVGVDVEDEGTLELLRAASWVLLEFSEQTDEVMPVSVMLWAVALYG